VVARDGGGTGQRINVGSGGSIRMEVRVQSDLGDFSSTVIEEVDGRQEDRRWEVGR
jgi:hypothetical protein